MHYLQTNFIRFASPILQHVELNLKRKYKIPCLYIPIYWVLFLFCMLDATAWFFWCTVQVNPCLVSVMSGVQCTVNPCLVSVMSGVQCTVNPCLVSVMSGVSAVNPCLVSVMSGVQCTVNPCLVSVMSGVSAQLTHVWCQSCLVYSAQLTHVWCQSCLVYSAQLTHVWCQSCLVSVHS